MRQFTLFDHKPKSIFRLAPAAKRLLCALLFAFALLPSAQAYENYVEAKLVFEDADEYGPMVESQSQAMANVQAYLSHLDGIFGGTRTASNLHAEPTRSEYYTLNGVWYRPYYDLTVCANGTCNFFPNAGYLNTWAECHQGWGVGYHVDSPTSHTAVCGQTLPDAQPLRKCDSCTGNPIYPSTGQKIQVETDYTGLPGLTFNRTYRSDLGFFASATTSTFADYSLPYGSKMQNCFPGYFTLSGYPETLKPYCYRYISIAQPKYQLFTADGRHLRFGGPDTAVTQSADVNERVTKVNASGGVEWHVKREDDSTEIYNAEGALTDHPPQWSGPQLHLF